MLTDRLARGWGAAKQFLYGLTGYEFARHAVEMRHEMEAVFMVVTMRNSAHATAITVITRKSVMSWLNPDWPGHVPAARVVGNPVKGDGPACAVR